MPEREELIIRETVTEEFAVDGVVVAEETISTEVEVEVREEKQVTIVLTSGAHHEFVYHKRELVGDLTRKAVKYFADHGKLDPTQQYELLLDKKKLEPRETLEEAGVKPCDKLTLSPCSRPIDG
jgi:hypothetical protein